MLLPLAGALPAATILSVDLTGKVGNEATQVFSDPSPQFTSVTLSRGGALSPAPLANGFGATGWSTFADDSKYLQIDIVPGAGVSYNINSIDINFQVYSDVWNFRLASSVDNFASKQSYSAGFIAQPATLAISMNPNLGSAQTGATSFRLYADVLTGLSSQSTGFISFSPAITIQGSAVPEPASGALFAGSLLMLTFRRRR
jgi:hypothetical protein